MNTSRRKFVLGTLLGSTSMLSHGGILGAPAILKKKKWPVVISTWDFGMVANLEAWKVLKNNGRAVDAVEAGVKIPEADPNNQSVGYGGLPDRDGRVTLDACIMDENYRCGSVMCIEHIVHAISVARLVMDKTPHVVLTGEGALQFALDNGFQKQDLLTEKSKKDWQEWLKTSKYEPQMNIENKLFEKDGARIMGDKWNHDTIGMVALDANGNVGGACTTSGLAYKMHGRVGDSPIIGAGLYVDNEVGGATSSGVGEEVIRIVGAHLIVELMRQGYSPLKACREGVNRIVKRNPERSRNIQVGFLAVNKAGEYGAYALQNGFTYSVKSNETEKTFHADYFYK